MNEVVSRAVADVKKLFKRSVLISAGATLSAAATVMAVDHYQKRDTQRKNSFPYLPRQQVEIGDTSTTVYTYGEHVFEDMLESIHGAKSTVYLESYIWKGDEYGRRFKDAVIDAHHRGVEVYLIFDSFANAVVPKKFYEFPAGIHVLPYPIFRPQILLLDLKYTGRDHRKILVVDEKIGFVGGFNIGSTYATQWRDTHMRITGPGVQELVSSFVGFWNYNRKSHLPHIESAHTPDWLPKIQAAGNAPIRQVYPVRHIYLEAFRRANHHIYLTQAYFIPDKVFLDELLTAAARGVDVRIIVPEASNHVLTDWLSRGQYSKMLRGGVTIWLFKNAMVHAKTGTVDGIWTTIGTANIDRLSLQGNYEINMSIYDPELATTMQRVFESDLTNCRQLRLDEWEDRSILNKVGEALLTPLSPLL